jgi:tetratricopeptide (TPR) repeat protein
MTSGSSGSIVNEYDSGLSDREITPRRSGFIDPQSAVIDQYISAWDRLNGDGQNTGSILVVDNYEDLDDEQIGFLDYVSKRMEIDESGFHTAIVYVVVVGIHPKLEEIAADIFGMKQVISHTLSPLKEPEIHDTIGRLQGRHVTSNDRRNLEGFLSRFREEPGAIPAALEDMINRGFLVYSDGQWRFDSSDVHQHPEAISSLSEYYKELPHQLSDHAREVLDWIVCHRGEIMVHRIADISGISLPDVFNAIDTIAPYRILEILAVSEHPSVGLFHERVQQSLYEVIDVRRRDYIHNMYIRAYEDVASSPDIGDANLHTSALRQLMHHYLAIGAFRLLLLNIIRAIRDLVSRRQYFELRALCNESLALLSDLKQREKPSRVESVRRYVLKQLIEANWVLDDYDTVKYVTRKHFRRRYHDIPLAIAFKYCLSLVFHNDYDVASSVAIAIKRRFPGRKSQAYNTASIIETNVLIQTGRYQDALSLITQVEHNEHVLAEYQRCRLYSCWLLILERLADEEGILKYVHLLEEITIRNGFHHEFQFCLLAPFNLALNKSLLSECKRTARRAISIASRARSYRRLVDWYFRASAVYYEDGSYDRAIKYVNKALPLAERLGLADEIASLVTRLAMNYLSAGAFGNAIVHIERALSIWSKDYNVNTGAVVHLFAFEAHLVANSRHVDTFYKRATAYMKRHSEVQRWGYYWYLVGTYRLRNREMTSAAKAFKKARRTYEDEGATDDAVRSGLKEVIALLGIRQDTEAARLIVQLTARLKGLESANIRAEYWAVKLSYQYHRRADRSVLKRHLNLCEEAFIGAEEIPVLLDTEKIIFRAKARVGDVSGAQKVFRTRLKRIKSILSNMPNREYAMDFLSDHDEQLLMQEFRLLEKKGARTSVPR